MEPQCGELVEMLLLSEKDIALISLKNGGKGNMLRRVIVIAKLRQIQSPIFVEFSVEILNLSTLIQFYDHMRR